MRIDLTVIGPDGCGHDVAVRAPAGARWADVRPALSAALPAGHLPAQLWSGPALVPDDATLGGRLLHCGAVLAPSPTDGRRAGGPVVQVVGGPSAGRWVAATDTVTLGRSVACTLHLDDPDVSRRHAAVTVTGSGAAIADLGSTNGTTVDGRPVHDTPTPLPPGRVARLGNSFVGVRTERPVRCATRDGPDGAVLVNRAPRSVPAVPDTCVDLPVAPEAGRRARVQWAAALLPALVGAGLAWAMHSVQFLLFAALSPVALLATGVSDRVGGRRGRRRARVEYRHAEAAARARLATAVAAETDLRRRAAPDPATVARIATTPERRLWERRRADTDLVRMRLGLGSASSTLQAQRGTSRRPAARLSAVPLGVDLAVAPLGIAAPRRLGVAIARWLLVQLATFAAPGDVGIALLLSEQSAPDWTWARWLPHLDGRVAATMQERQALLAGLSALVDERRASGRDRAGPRMVLVVDAAAQPAGLASVLDAADAGVTAICLAEREPELPAACRAVLHAAGETGALMTLRDTDGRSRSLVADCPSEELAERVARALAPLVDPGAARGTALPGEIRLVDLLGLPDPSAGRVAERVAARWAADDGRATAVLGVGLDGVVELDLDRDGPHALVAGTTGAGKSELLQALVLGMAAAHPPEAVNFLLVDYKGGAAFADCARLPHVAGLVTDLDAHLTRRALLSLDSELRAREELLAAAGVPDLAAYRTSGGGLARLVIVVDEFAALAEELPDFVTGLIGVAQRGRSLGVHLVLATQRPGGAVSAEIRANATLRIALRTTSAAESADVIDGPEAGTIDRRIPGRAFVRLGTSTVPVQVGRVGAPARGAADDPITVEPLDAWRRPPTPPIDDTARTDLAELVAAICAAAESGHHARASRPWLPPLPAVLSAAGLADVPGAEPPGTVRIGLLDVPAGRAQPPLTVDLGGSGSVLVVGAPRSGRTTALLGLALAAATALGPADLHVHAVDCGGRGLAPLTTLPHTGTYVAADDGVEPAATLLLRLEAELARRRAALSAAGVGSVTEARARGEPVPLLLMLLDGWEAFVAAADEHDSGRTVHRLLALLRDAPSCGMAVAVSGDRGALAPRLAGATTMRLVLRLSDRADYALAGIAARDVPADLPPGRAIRVDDGASVQFAFPGATPDRVGQVDAVAACAARWRDRAAAGPAGIIRVRPLPGRVRLADLPPVARGLRLGVGGDAAEVVAIDLFAGAGRLLVAGPPGSGRSTALCTLLREARSVGSPVLVVAPRRSPVHALSVATGTPIIDPDGPAPDLPNGRALLLVDDCETVADGVLNDALRDWVRGTCAGKAAVVAGRSDDLAVAFRGLGSEVRRGRCALLLQPGPVDGDLAGVRLPRTRSVGPPGRGVLVADPAWGLAERVLPVQVACEEGQP